MFTETEFIAFYSGSDGVVSAIGAARAPFVGVEVPSASREFAETVVNDALQRMLTVDNWGGLEWTLAEAAVMGDDFTLISVPPLPAIVAPEDSLSLNIQFAPLNVGARSGTLTLRIPEHPNGGVDLLLSGDGNIISIATDRSSYRSGEQMAVTLALSNPARLHVPAALYVALEADGTWYYLPSGTTEPELIDLPNLPPGFLIPPTEILRSMMPPEIPPAEYSWRAGLVSPTTGRLLGLPSVAAFTSSRTYLRISAAEVAARLAAGYEWNMVDTRSSTAYCAGHLPGAISIPSGELPSRYGELDNSLETLVLCHDNLCAIPSAEFLIGSGFIRVTIMDGGINGWTGQLVPCGGR